MSLKLIILNTNIHSECHGFFSFFFLFSTYSFCSSSSPPFILLVLVLVLLLFLLLPFLLLIFLLLLLLLLLHFLLLLGPPGVHGTVSSSGAWVASLKGLIPEDDCIFLSQELPAPIGPQLQVELSLFSKLIFCLAWSFWFSHRHSQIIHVML